MSKENKLTEEEIVKALEYCSNDSGRCTHRYDCVFAKCSNCTSELAKNALDLICRLQEQNESLKPDHYRASWKAKFFETKQENEKLKTELRKECEEHEEFTKKAKAEIERLTEREKFLENAWHTSIEHTETVERGLNASEARNAELQKQVDEFKKINEKLKEMAKNHGVEVDYEN